MATDKDAKTTAAKKPAFEITVPNKGYRDERFGVRFMDGVGHTDDATRAHMCLEITGATVTKNGKPWPEPESKSK